MLKRIIIYFLFTLCASFIPACLFSMILAETGRYSVNIVLAFFAGILILSPLFLRKYFYFINTNEIRNSHLILLIFIVLAGIFLYWPPSEYILGGWDPGVYTATSASLIKHGCINFPDGLLAGLNSEERKIFLGTGFGLFEFYPGMRVMNPPAGNIVGPQFFHMYPVLSAPVYSFFGIKGALFVNPLIGLVSILAIYALCYVLIGPLYAILGPFFLFAGPIQIWMARFQNSEMLTQLSYLLGFTFYFLSFPKANSAADPAPNNSRFIYFPILSALCFWTGSLARYDFLLIVTPLVFFGIIQIAWKTPDRYIQKARFVSTFLVFLSMIHAFIYQKHIAYLYRALLKLFETGACAAILSSLLSALFIWLARDKIKKIWEAGLKPLRWIAVFGFIFTAAYYLFLRAHQADLGWERFNFQNLASFVSWPVMVLAFIGILSSFLKSEYFEEFVFILIGLFVAFLVTLNKHIDAFYPWGARRFLPVAIPFIIVYAVNGAKILGTRMSSMIQKHSLPASSPGLLQYSWIIFLGVIYFFFTQPSRAELLGYRDYYGMTDFFTHMARDIPKSDLIITQERGVAEVLHFHFDFPAVYLRNPAPQKLNTLREIMQKRLERGEKIFILTQNKSLFINLAGFHFETIRTFTWSGKCINNSRNGFPAGYRERGFDLVLMEVQLNS